MNVAFGNRVLMIVLGGQPRRQRNTGIWTLRILQQAWLADSATVGAAGKG